MADTNPHLLFDAGRKIALTRWRGVFSTEAAYAGVEVTRQFIGRHGTCDLILDLSDVDDVTMPPQELIDYASRGALIKEFKRVLVAPTEMTYGLGLLFQSYQIEGMVEVVRSMDEAYRYLGVDKLDLKKFE